MVAALLILPGPVQCAERTSASFAISFDVIVAGGGADRSAAYEQKYSVIGQAIVSGSSTSSSFTEVSGFVPAAHFVPVRISSFLLD